MIITCKVSLTGVMRDWQFGSPRPWSNSFFIASIENYMLQYIPFHKENDIIKNIQWKFKIFSGWVSRLWNGWDQLFFRFLDLFRFSNIFMYTMSCVRMWPESKHKLCLCFRYTSYTWSKDNLQSILSNFIYETKFYGVEFSTYFVLVLKHF